MNSIFEIFLTLFMSIWEAIDGLLSPLLSIIGEYTPKIIGFVVDIISFIFGGLFKLLDGLFKLISFDWLPF